MSREEANPNLHAKRLLGASLAWLVVGACTGLLLALQRVAPWLFERWSWWSMTRVQLYHSSILIFGFCFPMLLGLWLLRLQKMRGQPLAMETLWEWANTLWQYGMLWGVVGCFFGFHGALPTWVWAPVVYGILLVASLMFAAAIYFNLPPSMSDDNVLSLRFFLVGTWALPLYLLLFLISTELRNSIAPTLLHALLFLALTFPLVGLLIPPSLSHSQAPDHGRLSFFYWGGLFLLPLSASSFSSSIGATGFTFAFQLGAVAAVGALLYTLLSWWRYPALYQQHWSRNPALPFQTSQAIPAGITRTSSSPLEDEGEVAPTESAPIWVSFFQWGALCLALVVLEALVFSVVRLMGNQPSPTWSQSHLYLLVLGCGVLWLQGALCLLKAPDAQERDGLRILRLCLFVGVLLFALGSWWEGLLHFNLEQTGLPRGTIHSVSGRWLRFLGGASLFYALWQFAKNGGRFIRHLDQPSP